MYSCSTMDSAQTTWSYSNHLQLVSHHQAQTKSADKKKKNVVIQTENLRNSANLPVLMSERPKMFHNSLTPDMVD